MQDVTAQLSTALADRYRIERHLGEGGMATVYLARDLKHDRPVALKVLRPELAAVIGSERFLNEIKVTANLQHPHILPLHDSGSANGFLFYVMPYIEGDTLRDRLDREQQLAIDEAVRITTAIASALDYAHRHGVIHRDIKPANILLHDGQPLVADFGIALAVRHAGGVRLTETGLSIGTPHYMSPEQAMGEREVDARSDVYSLAAVLYEMLAGEPPHTASSAQAVLAKILTAKPAPVSKDRDTVPPNIDAALAKALSRMPADRFASASAFADALSNPSFTVTSSTTHAAAVEPTRAATSRARAALVGVGALAAVALAFLGGRASAPETPSLLTRFTVAIPEGLTLGGVPSGPAQALSPDGEWLVFVAPGGGPAYRRRLGQLEAEPIPGTDGAAVPFFSPDGAWLGFYADGRLRKIPMGGGPSVPIADVSGSGVAGASWGDNDVIAYIDNAPPRLYTVPGAGGVRTLVPQDTTGPGYNHPWMLPGGRAALMTVRAASPDDVRMVVVDLETGAADTLGVGTRATYASGHLVFSGADGTLLAQPFDPGARRTTGQAVALLDGVALGGPGMGQFALSAQGGLAYQFGDAGTQTLTIAGPAGTTEVQLPEQGDIEDPTFSPDGRRLAFRFVDVGESQDIRIWNQDQGTLERLTVEGSVNQSPVWTPDGTRVAFASTRVGRPPQLYWQPADGSGPAELLLETDFAAYPVSWSPDGRTLAFVAIRNGNADIGLLALGDSTPRWVLDTEFAEDHPQISPDARWLAYSSNRSGTSEVYVQATSGEGSRFQVSTDGGHSPRWSPDGGTLYFASGVGSVGPIMAAAVSAEGGFRVTSRVVRIDLVQDLNPNGSVNYDVGPDGEELVYVGVPGASQRSLVWILNWPELLREMGGGR